MKKVIVLLIVAVFLSAILVNTACAGWKENYRNKYSKKTLDPDSEKAKKIRRLGNFDMEFQPWKRSKEERAAMGMKPRPTTLSANIMPWKEENDKFQGYTANFSPARKDLPAEEKKTGRTLTGALQTIGAKVGDEAGEVIGGVKTEAEKVIDRIK